jgi:hypothetical protein
MPNQRIASFVESLSEDQLEEICNILRIPKSVEDRRISVSSRLDSMVRYFASMRYIMNWKVTTRRDLEQV